MIIIVTTRNYPLSGTGTFCAINYKSHDEYIVQKSGCDAEYARKFAFNAERGGTWCADNKYLSEGLPIMRTSLKGFVVYVAPCLTPSKSITFRHEYINEVLNSVLQDFRKFKNRELSAEDYPLYLIAHDMDLLAKIPSSRKEGNRIFVHEELSKNLNLGRFSDSPLKKSELFKTSDKVKMYIYQHEVGCEMYDRFVGKIFTLDETDCQNAINLFATR